MDFMNIYENTEESKSSIDKSIESHIMAYAAEQSRLRGQVITIDDIKEELLNS